MSTFHTGHRGDALLIGVAIGLHDEGTVDFDPAYRKAADGRDGGMAGTEIIKVNAATELAQGIYVSGDHIIGGGSDDRFQYFDCEPFGG